MEISCLQRIVRRRQLMAWFLLHRYSISCRNATRSQIRWAGTRGPTVVRSCVRLVGMRVGDSIWETGFRFPFRSGGPYQKGGHESTTDACHFTRMVRPASQLKGPSKCTLATFQGGDREHPLAPYRWILPIRPASRFPAPPPAAFCLRRRRLHHTASPFPALNMPSQRC